MHKLYWFDNYQAANDFFQIQDRAYNHYDYKVNLFQNQTTNEWAVEIKRYVIKY